MFFPLPWLPPRHVPLGNIQELDAAMSSTSFQVFSEGSERRNGGGDTKPKGHWKKEAPNRQPQRTIGKKAPICFMYGIFTYIYQTIMINVPGDSIRDQT